MAWDSGFQLPSEGFLNGTQRAQLERIFDALQPSDQARNIPGARQSDAANYVDLLLNWDKAPSSVQVHEDLPKWKLAYPRWLAAFDRVATGHFDKPLAELSRREISQLLQALEEGSLAGFGDDQSAAFDTLWRHCIQGCWGDPRWGGNREKIMWRWLGYLQAPETVTLAGEV